MGAIDEYDNLYVTVRGDKAAELTGYYRAFGWEKVSSRAHTVHVKRIDMSFRRPHRIEDKDELQLWQVYLETDLNLVGRLEKIPRPRTLAAGITLFLLSLCMIAAGICLVYLFKGFLYTFLGWTLTALGAALAVAGIVITVRLGIKEGAEARCRLAAAKEEIVFLCERAERLTSRRVCDEE